MLVVSLLLLIVTGAGAYFWRARSDLAASRIEDRELRIEEDGFLRSSIFDSPSLVSDSSGGPTPPIAWDNWLASALVTPPADRGLMELDHDKKLATFQAPAPGIAKRQDAPSSSLARPFKRRNHLSEEELLKDLRWAKEIPPMTSATTSQVMNRHMERFRTFGDIDFEPRVLLEVRPDLRTLPVRHGSPIQLDGRAAAALEAFSRKLHYLVDNTVPRKEDGEHVKPGVLREKMSQEIAPGRRPPWLRPEAVPALRQILMGEDKPLRWLLVELLAENPSPAASAALAQRAVFELSPDLRQRAVQALQGRPRQDFRHVLLYGLRYPWAPAADYAAEALAALGDRDAVPSLVTYLKKPDPQLPFHTSQDHSLVREIVRINHQANCLMCHSPAVSGWKDPVAGKVPGVFLTGTIEGGSRGYHTSEFPKLAVSPLLVRADIVFLRQDFSVPLSSGPTSAGPAADQRFDFLIRTRRVKSQEVSEFKTATTSTYPQREAVLWALRELTGKDAGSKTEDWAKLFPRAELDAEVGRLAARLTQTRGSQQIQLLAKFKDGEGVTYTLALAEAIAQMKGKNQDRTRQALAERLSRLSEEDLRDRLRDDHREIRRAAAAACVLKGHDDLVPDLLDLLQDPEPGVVEAAQNALGHLTGRETGASG
jgi:HEAT repeat protein